MPPNIYRCIYLYIFTQTSLFIAGPPICTIDCVATKRQISASDAAIDIVCVTAGQWKQIMWVFLIWHPLQPYSIRPNQTNLEWAIYTTTTLIYGYNMCYVSGIIRDPICLDSVDKLPPRFHPPRIFSPTIYQHHDYLTLQAAQNTFENLLWVCLYDLFANVLNVIWFMHCFAITFVSLFAVRGRLSVHESVSVWFVLWRRRQVLHVQGRGSVRTNRHQ